jgi:hypothetical protein
VPRVVIELQANTQQAVQQIQQFAKAQRDAFDAIRAGNPALDDARIKVSTLTEAYGGLAKAQSDLGRQGPPAAASIQTITKAMTDARGAVIAYGTATSEQKAATSRFMDELKAGAEKSTVAMTGFRTVTRNLIGDIPIVGGVLSKLATTFGTFPLLIGGIVGAGVTLIKIFQDISAEISRTSASIDAMATRVQTKLTATINQIAQLRAARAGDQPGALEAGAKGELDTARAARDAAIKAAGQAAEAAIPGFFSIEQFAAKGLGITTLLNTKLEGIANERRNAELAAEAEFQLKAYAIREKLAGDLEKLEADRVKNYEANRDKEVGAEAAAAAKEQQIIAATAQAAQQAQQAIRAAGQAQVAADMSRIAAADAAATAARNAAAASGGRPSTRYPLAGGPTWTPAPGYSYVDTGAKGPQGEPILTQKPIQPPEFYGTPGGQPTSMEPYTVTETPEGTAYTQGYQHGGLVPGVGPVPIIAHGGERILPVHGEREAGAVKMVIQAGAIQLSGTIIDQQRGWGTLVEELGQALETRLRRRAR